MAILCKPNCSLNTLKGHWPIRKTFVHADSRKREQWGVLHYLATHQIMAYPNYSVFLEVSTQSSNRLPNPFFSPLNLYLNNQLFIITRPQKKKHVVPITVPPRRGGGPPRRGPRGPTGGGEPLWALRVFFLRACNDKQLVIQVEF